MNKQKTIYATIVGAFSILTSWLGDLAIPVYILLACNIFDYITGITAAKNRGKVVSSSYGFIGIVKKVFMYILIVIGFFIDVMLEYIGTQLNIPIKLPYVVACGVAIWLVLNEIISILENLNDIGVKMPPFLMPLVNRLKVQVDKKTEISEITHTEDAVTIKESNINVKNYVDSSQENHEN